MTCAAFPFRCRTVLAHRVHRLHRGAILLVAQRELEQCAQTGGTRRVGEALDVGLERQYAEVIARGACPRGSFLAASFSPLPGVARVALLRADALSPPRRRRRESEDPRAVAPPLARLRHALLRRFRRPRILSRPPLPLDPRRGRRRARGGEDDERRRARLRSAADVASPPSRCFATGHACRGAPRRRRLTRRARSRSAPHGCQPASIERTTSVCEASRERVEVQPPGRMWLSTARGRQLIVRSSAVCSIIADLRRTGGTREGPIPP